MVRRLQQARKSQLGSKFICTRETTNDMLFSRASGSPVPTTDLLSIVRVEEAKRAASPPRACVIGSVDLRGCLPGCRPLLAVLGGRA